MSAEGTEGKAEHYEEPPVKVIFRSAEETDESSTDYNSNLCHLRGRMRVWNMHNRPIAGSFFIGDSPTGKGCIYNGMLLCSSLNFSFDGRRVECKRDGMVHSFDFKGLSAENIEICEQLSAGVQVGVLDDKQFVLEKLKDDSCQMTLESKAVPYDWYDAETEQYQDSCETMHITPDGVLCDDKLAVGALWDGGGMVRCPNEPCGPSPEADKQ